jgi:selenocysteine lyase/cysteine desulfurase
MPSSARACLTANTTTAIALLAGSSPWQRGDRILICEDSAPSNRLPWLAVASQHELEVVELPSRDGRLELEDLEAACRQPVAWASFASVSLGAGDLRPMGEIRRLVQGAGGLLCVDAAQALGCVPLGLADAVVGSGRKWLCGPPEVGFLLMSEAAAEGLVPLSAGSCSGAGARALEGGVPPIVPALGLLESLRLFRELGWDTIQRGVRENVSLVLEAGLAANWTPRFSHPAERQGPLVHFALPEGCPRDLEARLEGRGIYARVLPKHGTLRVSPHAWTSAAEIEELFRVLGDLAR